MDAINAFIVRRQSAHKMSPSNAIRKAMAINLKATRRPCWQTRQGHREGVVSTMTILIPQWRILPQGCQLPQCVHDKRKLQRYANQRRSQRSYAWCNDGNYRHRQHGGRKPQQQQKKKPSWHVRQASHAWQLLCWRTFTFKSETC